MSTVFSEVYGTYYNIVAKLMDAVIDGTLSMEKMQQLILAEGYADSTLQLLPALRDGTWKLLMQDCTTPLKHKPTMPLTLLQKRWLKTLLADYKIRLFFTDAELRKQDTAMQNIEPLYSSKQIIFFDRYVDGDDYSDPRYKRNFKEILKAIKEKHYMSASYKSSKGNIIVWTDLVPLSLEYSAKDDKFRLQALARQKHVTLNVGRVISVEVGQKFPESKVGQKNEIKQQKLVLEINDERSTMVRALLYFSDLAKETEKLDEHHYLLTLYYDKSDEAEMVFRVLSFGPTVYVLEPKYFRKLIQSRLQEQFLFSGKN